MSDLCKIDFNSIAQSEIEPPEKIVGCILFTDVKSSSILWGFYNNIEWQNFIYSIIDKHFKIMESLLNIYNSRSVSRSGEKGFIIKTIGDAAMIYCPYDIAHCLHFALCLQYCITLLNKWCISHPMIQRIPDKGISLHSKIHGSELSDEHELNIFSIRLGFCYGNFFKVNTHIQCDNFIDIFGPGVNLASRMESKISSYPGAIAFTYYFADGDEDFNQQIKIAIIKCRNLIMGYDGFMIPTSPQHEKDKLFKILKQSDKIDLHGALPNQMIYIYLLVPKIYEIDGVANNLKFLDINDTKIASSNFKSLFSVSYAFKHLLFRREQKRKMRGSKGSRGNRRSRRSGRSGRLS